MQALRRLHNQAKMDALTSAVRSAHQGCGSVRLLDIGCGPSSDIHKYARLGVTSVIGLDNDPDVIAEAHRRAEQYRGLDYKFELCRDVLGRLATMEANSADIATCHFSVHFFTDGLEELCKAVRRVVRPGGVWVVATINGSSVPDSFRGDHLQVLKSACRTRMVYRLEHTRYFGSSQDSANEEPVLPTEDLLRAATAAGWCPSCCTNFGASGLPRQYTPELAMITNFHEWLHLV